MFKHSQKHTRQKSAGERNGERGILLKIPGLATSCQSSPMHFSSATPAGQVLLLTERHAKAIQDPSATSSQLPKIPNCTLANRQSRSAPSEGLRARNSAPSTCPRGAARALWHPWDGQTRAILFSNSKARAPARQKSCFLPKDSGPSSQNNRGHLLTIRPNCRTS